MENIEERLRRLEAADCKVCGFTVDNAGPGFQDRFIALLPEAKNLVVLALTRLPPLNEIKDEWRRGQAEKYRREKKIADSPERAAYFYAQTLPRLLNILSRLPAQIFITSFLSRKTRMRTARSRQCCTGTIRT